MIRATFGQDIINYQATLYILEPLFLYILLLGMCRSFGMVFFSDFPALQYVYHCILCCTYMKPPVEHTELVWCLWRIWKGGGGDEDRRVIQAPLHIEVVVKT